MAALLPSHELIQGLAQDQNLPRIKKLLIYACRRTWETDPDRINKYDLDTLIREILTLCPTLKQLKLYLDRVVQTLNKRAEYTLISNAIINHLKEAYTEYQQLSQVAIRGTSYQTIAQSLSQDADVTRIQKLLFCAARNRWENDPSILNTISLMTLVQELHALTPSIEQLEAVLQSIIQTLNRRENYLRVGQAIVDAFQPLYPDQSPDPTEQTQVIVEDVTSPLAATPQPSQPTIISATPVRPESGSSAPTQKAIDWFDLRLEIMKYTSPLRAKVLLFSLVFQAIDSSAESWLLLKSHDLDELLKNALQKYSSLSELETHLKQLAKTLTPSDQYSQAAGAILRAVKPLGVSFAVANRLTKDSTSDASEPTPVVTEPPRRRVKGSEFLGLTGNDADGVTCQMFSTAAQMPLSEEGDREDTVPLSPNNVRESSSSTEEDSTQISSNQEQAYQSFITSIQDLFQEKKS